MRAVQSTARAAAVAFASLLGLAATGVRAQTGGAAVVFLMIEPDSRAAGMGNSGVALADNSYAVFWNPAGLGYQRGAEASITHSAWLPEFNADLYYESLVGKYNIGAGTLGGHVTFLNLGEHEYRDAAGNFQGNFRSYDLATGLSYGFKATKNLALGVGGRLIYSNLAGKSFDGLEEQETKAGISGGLDLSALYRTQPMKLGGTDLTASAGFNLSNLGPTIRYTEKSDENPDGDPIPTNLRFGYALQFDLDEYNSFTFTNDFTKMLTRSRVDSSSGTPVLRSDNALKAILSSWAPIRVAEGTGEDEEFREIGVLDQLIIGLGAEYWYNRLFAARAGYFYENPYNGDRQFLTFGAGVRYSIVGVDFSYIYALEQDHPLANTMRFSLLLNFGK